MFHNINYWRKPKLLNALAYDASGNRQRKVSYKIHDCIFDETLHHFKVIIENKTVQIVGYCS